MMNISLECTFVSAINCERSGRLWIAFDCNFKDFILLNRTVFISVGTRVIWFRDKSRLRSFSCKSPFEIIDIGISLSFESVKANTPVVCANLIFFSSIDLLDLGLLLCFVRACSMRDVVCPMLDFRMTKVRKSDSKLICPIRRQITYMDINEHYFLATSGTLMHNLCRWTLFVTVVLEKR